jgi:preprotein translocase subunit SecD
MTRTGIEMRMKKAGLSGLFHSAIAATFVIVFSSAATGEPLAIKVTEVTPGFDQRTKQPIVSFRMTPESTKLFAEFTTNNIGRVVEIRIDGKTIMTPVIREPILGGSGQVFDPSWTVRDVAEIADRLNNGQSRIEFELKAKE